MRNITILLSVLCAMVLGGCAVDRGLQTTDAELARAILAKHCVVGLIHKGNQTLRKPVREGEFSRRNVALLLSQRHKVIADQVHIHSVKDLLEGWVVVDASSQRVRDNLYFNRQTAEFACSTDEWRYGRGDSMTRSFDLTPLILRSTPPNWAN